MQTDAEGNHKKYCQEQEYFCVTCSSELYVGTFLERVSLSRDHDNDIIKDGFLIASMVGLESRAAMDMDAMIKGYLVKEEAIAMRIDA